MKKLAPIIAAIIFIISSQLYAANIVHVTQSVADAQWQSRNTGDALEFVPQGVQDIQAVIYLDPQCGKAIKCSGFYITCNGVKAHVIVSSYPYTTKGAYYCRTSRAFTVVNDGTSAGAATGTITIDVLR